jgi:DNA mismatch endonuclease (patch repair protein)
MARVRSKDTLPELIVRNLCFSMGFRYRLHVKRLPGCPDLVFPARRKVILVNGCFWHQHSGCRRALLPKTRIDFWLDKLSRNKRRDAINKRRLTRLGWTYLVIWECETKDAALLAKRLKTFLATDAIQ